MRELRPFLMALATAGCISSPDQTGRADALQTHEIEAGEMTTRAEMRIDLELPARVRPGEAVPIELSVRNTGAKPVELWLTGDPVAFDLIVTRPDGAVVWQRLHGKVIAEILQQRLLRPGEVMHFSGQWEQRDNDGKPVPPGTYYVRGTVPAEDLNLETERREFVISP